MTTLKTPTVAFSTRNLRSDLRDRLHALAAIREARTGRRTSLESVVNEALEQGVLALEARWFGAATAAKIAKANAPQA